MKNILIGVLVLMILYALIMLTVVLVSPDKTPTTDIKEPSSIHAVEVWYTNGDTEILEFQPPNGKPLNRMVDYGCLLQVREHNWSYKNLPCYVRRFKILN